MTELRFWVEKYINSEKVLYVIDDLDLSYLGVIGEAKVDLNPSSAQAKLSIGKRPVVKERDAKKKPKYYNQPACL